MARQKWQEWVENEEKLTILAAWARAGKTDDEIAKLVGISRSTLGEWKKKHEKISEALSTGKDYADRLVENSLYRAALGYTVTNKKPIKTRHVTYEDGKKIKEDEVIEYAEETVHVEGDTKAIVFWLENRMPEWRKRCEEIKNSNIEDENGVGLIVMGTEQADEIKKLMEVAQEQSEKEQQVTE
ncbi:hypothetical protein HMPREF1097_03966 [Enterocloster bolteae 90B8]|mgnify:FL=1|uniref:Helix-turn-helix domain-containing protein n=1 Tax=Enterocloster bolteae 90B8 TaxID=997897 RepID=R0AP74_9FIRM|nr:helix-turn-helix domain-containing protein [Enterocloster clostridioformis]ENZ34579.1 hypothetical protein HMPREF1097_03966 [Enterocloster bolteae 90B8]